MTKNKDLFIIYFLLMLEILILFNSNVVINNVISSSKLFITKIFPSLFPTMIIGLLLVKLDFYKIIPNFINKIFNKLFNFSKIHTSIFLSAILCGAPTYSAIINEYLNKGLISEKEAESLLCSCHFINPLFVISGVGKGVFNDEKIGFLLLFMIFLSNFFKIFILRKNFITNNTYSIEHNSISFLEILFNTIKSSINAILNIFSIVILFNILLSLISNIFSLNNFLNTIINISLELTSGIYKLKYLNINIFFKILLSYYFLSFGGLCICLQTLFMIPNKKIKHLKYFIFRILP